MNVFVGCSSTTNVAKNYLEYADVISDLIIKNNDNLIAGGRVGIMNQIINNLDNVNIKSQIITIEKFSNDINFNDQATILKNNLERSDEVFGRSNLLIFMPGGIGTLGELLMALELKRNNNYHFQIIILNIDDYYHDIISFLKMCKKKKMLDDDLNDLFIVCNSLRSLKIEYNKIKLGGLK